MSSTLWAHLLNKDATTSGLGLKTGLAAVGLNASAPPDKGGTSVRILLHDTQATIEKFSERVDKLVSGAEDSRQKLLARNEEVNDEVERLVRRVIQDRGALFLLETISKTLLLPDLVLTGYVLSNPCAYIDPDFSLSTVGRAETTLQSSIREPAQAPVLAELRQWVSSSLDALNQKVEAVQNVGIVAT